MMIDMRVRPPFGSFLQDTSINGENFSQNMAETFDYMPQPSQRSHDVADLLTEMDALAIDRAVMPVRLPNGGDNHSLLPLLEAHGDRFVGLAGVSLGDDPEVTRACLEQDVLAGPFQGLSIEPQREPSIVRPDHPRAYWLYERMEREGIPLMVTFGAYGHPSLAQFQPQMLDQLALDFPKLTLIVGHGGWPYVNEMCWIAYKRKNVYLSPDYLVTCAGGREYLRAACTMLVNKVLFGSAYPILSVAAALEIYTEIFDEVRMRDRIRAKVLGENAAAALGL